MRMFCGKDAPLGPMTSRVLKGDFFAIQLGDFCRSCLEKYATAQRDYAAFVAWRSARNFGDWHIEPAREDIPRIA